MVTFGTGCGVKYAHFSDEILLWRGCENLADNSHGHSMSGIDGYKAMPNCRNDFSVPKWLYVNYVTNGSINTHMLHLIQKYRYPRLITQHTQETRLWTHTNFCNTNNDIGKLTLPVSVFEAWPSTFPCKCNIRHRFHSKAVHHTPFKETSEESLPCIRLAFGLGILIRTETCNTSSSPLCSFVGGNGEGGVTLPFVGVVGSWRCIGVWFDKFGRRGNILCKNARRLEMGSSALPSGWLTSGAEANLLDKSVAETGYNRVSFRLEALLKRPY